jgi:hypothetical protein
MALKKKHLLNRTDASKQRSSTEVAPQEMNHQKKAPSCSYFVAVIFSTDIAPSQ